MNDFARLQQELSKSATAKPLIEPGEGQFSDARSLPVNPVKPLIDWLPLATRRFNVTWPYIRLMIDHLDRLTRGEFDRLRILLPPRHGKTALGTIRFPVWRLERQPALRVCVGSFNEDTAKRFSHAARQIARRRLKLSKERRSVLEWETTEGGCYRACSVGNPPMGQGFQLVILDDVFGSREDALSQSYRDKVWSWYTDDIMTRLEPGGQAVLINTCWDTDDLDGRISRSEEAADWKTIRLPALAEANDPLHRAVGEALCPDRFPRDRLLRQKRLMTATGWMSLYQQAPTLEGGNLFKRGWFPPYELDRDYVHFPRDGSQVPRHDLAVFLTVDPAMGRKGGDDTGLMALAVTPSNRLLVLEAQARLIPIEELPSTVQRWATQWGAQWVGVEANGFQLEAVKNIREQTGLAVRELQPGNRRKLVRAQRAIVMAEQGQIFIPAPDPHHDWVTPFLDELARFTGERPDELDAMCDCLAYGALEMGQITERSEAPASGDGRGRDLATPAFFNRHAGTRAW